MVKAWTGQSERGDPQAGSTTKQRGDAAEERALAHLRAQGLKLLARNYRLAGGPSQRGAELDLVMAERDGTVVFVEVRSRRSVTGAGGAAASVDARKQQRLVRAAQHYLMRLDRLPPCRFDVVVIEGAQLHWLRAAFDAG